MRHFLEIEFDPHSQMLASRDPRTRPPPSPSLLPAKQVAKDSAEGVENVFHVGEACTAASRTAPTRPLEGIVPDPVVQLPLLVVRQYLVRLGGLLEPTLGFFIPRISIGMVGRRSLAVSALDLVGVRRLRDTEHFVEIA